MTTLEYKGYQGSAEVDAETDVLVGKILFITDLVTYEAKTVQSLRKEFQAAVDDYLETCLQLGRDPQQPSVAFLMSVLAQLYTEVPRSERKRMA